MNILLDARMVGAKLHGIARYTLSLAVELNRLGHQVSFIVASGISKKFISEYFEDQNVKLQNFHDCDKRFAHPLEPWALNRTIKNLNYDVFHFTSFAIPTHMPERSVVTVHDMTHFYGKGSWKYKLYYKNVLAPAYKRASALITVSKWSKNDISEKLSIEPDKISIVRNGVEKKWFAIEPFNSLNATDSTLPPTFFCLSNPKPHKNFETLLKACNLLWREGMNFDLVASLGTNYSVKNKLVDEKYLSRIKIFTYLHDKEILNYYRTSLALISPSLLEGYNYPVAEALSLGCPVILSDIDVHKEFESSNLHFYHSPKSEHNLAKAMKEILNNKNNIENKKDSNVITTEEMAKQTLEVYKKI